jgi:molecular chaperone DnaK (HSP70)
MTCLGIDLGTTNSVVAIYEEGRARILPNVLGASSTPSVVGLADDRKTILVGEAARARLISHADVTAASRACDRRRGSSAHLHLHVALERKLAGRRVRRSRRPDEFAELECPVIEAIEGPRAVER